MDWEKYGFVTVSKVRKNILISLNKRPRLPSELANGLKMDKSQVSRALKELEEMGLIECLAPKHRKGRVYGLTNNGRNIMLKLK
ncbi:MAG: winged helix-turn-helix transcriptional regulator [Candidatus Aenigmarchaeota archaeon]|nr:winged helix-turn-helix transcriptional regulator [Candidatus Aenigmarchaeota archaeon]